MATEPTSDEKQKLIDRLKAEYGEVHELAFEGRTIFVKKPPRAEWKRFRKLASDPARRDEAMEQLLFGCCVHPDKAGLDKMLEDLPALDVQFGAELVRLAGGKGDAEAKKL